MLKSKLLIYISISVLIIIILPLSFYILRANDKADRAAKINLATLDPDLYDQSWFTGDPCAAPCWYGLKPGETSKENAKKIVSELPFLDNAQIRESYGIVSFPYKFQKDNRAVFGAMTFEDDILEEIYITPNYSMSLEQAVKKLGDPDGFTIITMDPSVDELYIIWSRKQLVITHTEPNTTMLFMTINESLHTHIKRYYGKIPKALSVDGVIYTTPYHIDIFREHLSEWKGFSIEP